MWGNVASPFDALSKQAVYERKMPGTAESCCVALIVSGCVIAGAGDLTFSLAGYGTALLCAAVQAGRSLSVVF